MPEQVYSLDQISQWQSQLKGFAKTPRTRFSKKQAVEALIVEIEAALRQHPFDEVAEKLKDWGLDIAAGSLKQYVNAYRREHGTSSDNATAKRSSSKSKKSTAKSSSKRSLSANEKAANAGAMNSAGGHSNNAASRAKSRAKAAADKTPSGFLEMAEDL